MDNRIEGGDEMIKSLEIVNLKIEQEKIIIEPVDKKRNGKDISKNWRGLFLVNIVSKVYEKVKKKPKNYTQQNVRNENSR